ncbi:hypothetical protein EPI10_028129 [Gossypium australe]|uniref:Uncharacterized protein n=1 Tax=Gossypium australe TaxID=47621 RepID=A0A5B6UU09_9ROSI|nr:hypothetical protein EPI10_028129 [Gossypium australe]
MVHNEGTLRDYVLPNLEMVHRSIIRPATMANNFEIKPTMIKMIQNNLLLGTRIYHDMKRTRRKILTKQNGSTDEGDGNVQTTRRRIYAHTVDYPSWMHMHMPRLDNELDACARLGLDGVIRRKYDKKFLLVANRTLHIWPENVYGQSYPGG